MANISKWITDKIVKIIEKSESETKNEKDNEKISSDNKVVYSTIDS